MACSGEDLPHQVCVSSFLITLEYTHSAVPRNQHPVKERVASWTEPDLSRIKVFTSHGEDLGGAPKLMLRKRHVIFSTSGHK